MTAFDPIARLGEVAARVQAGLATADDAAFIRTAADVQRLLMMSLYEEVGRDMARFHARMGQTREMLQRMAKEHDPETIH